MTIFGKIWPKGDLTFQKNRLRRATLGHLTVTTNFNFFVACGEPRLTTEQFKKPENHELTLKIIKFGFKNRKNDEKTEKCLVALKTPENRLQKILKTLYNGGNLD